MRWDIVLICSNLLASKGMLSVVVLECWGWHLTWYSAMQSAAVKNWSVFLVVAEHSHCVGKISQWISNLTILLNRTDPRTIIKLSDFLPQNSIGQLIFKLIFGRFKLTYRLVTLLMSILSQSIAWSDLRIVAANWVGLPSCHHFFLITRSFTFVRNWRLALNWARFLGGFLCRRLRIESQFMGNLWITF